MKPAKMKLITIYVGITIVFLVYYILNSTPNSSHFTVTPDTNVSANPKLAKYVSQEEIDDFAFRYWDIDDEREYKEENATITKLRHLLKAKKTDEVLNFIKSNNLHIDTRMSYKLTPLMYSSFYNDDTTARELIRLGADVHATDTYKLSPLAYAIENNSTKTAKLLLDSGVKFEEVKAVQYYIMPPFYTLIDKLIIDGDDIKIMFIDNYVVKQNSKDAADPMRYIVVHNYIELAQMVLESGYVPQLSKNPIDGLPGVKDGEEIKRSLYSVIDDIPNHEPMLELLLKYNVVGKPDERILKAGHEQCRYNLRSLIRSKFDYVYKNNKGIDDQKEAKLRKKYGKANNVEKDTKDLIERGIIVRIPIPLDPRVISKYNVYINGHEKYCPIKGFKFEDIKDYSDLYRWLDTEDNETFTDIKTFFAWANGYRKHYEISSFLNRHRNDPAKVIYVENNSTNKSN